MAVHSHREGVGTVHIPLDGSVFLHQPWSLGDVIYLSIYLLEMFVLGRVSVGGEGDGDKGVSPMRI